MHTNKIEFLRDDKVEERNKIFEEVLRIIKPKTKAEFAARFLRAMFVVSTKLHDVVNLEEKLEKEINEDEISPEIIEKLADLVPESRLESPVHYSLFVVSGKVMARASIFFDPVIEKTVYHLIEPKVDHSMLDEVKRSIKWRMKFDNKILENRDYLVKKVKKACNKLKIGFQEEFYDIIKYYLYRNVIDLGKINALLYDNHIYEIICDGINKPLRVFHGKFRYLTTNIFFRTEEELNELLFRLAERANSEISDKKPLLNIKYKNFRIQAALGFEEISSKFVIRREA